MKVNRLYKFLTFGWFTEITFDLDYLQQTFPKPETEWHGPVRNPLGANPNLRTLLKYFPKSFSMSYTEQFHGTVRLRKSTANLMNNPHTRNRSSICITTHANTCRWSSPSLTRWQIRSDNVSESNNVAMKHTHDGIHPGKVAVCHKTDEILRWLSQQWH